MHYCASIQPKRESSKTYTDFTKLVIDNHAELDVNNLDVCHFNINIYSRDLNSSFSERKL